MSSPLAGIQVPPVAHGAVSGPSAATGAEEAEAQQEALPPEAAVVQMLRKSSPPPLTYDPRGSSNAVEQYEQLQKLVSAYLQEQGLAAEVAIGGGESKAIEDLSPEEAAGLVAEDGYWGAEQTSDRIVEFAVAMVGGDPSRVEEVRAGLQKGFAEAEEALGSLPGVSEQTIDQVFAKFDDAVAGLSGSAEVEA